MDEWCELCPDDDRRSAALDRLLLRVTADRGEQNRARPARTEIVLTPMQLAVLQSYASGLTRPTVAAVLGIGEETVATHSKHARRLLRAKTTTQAVAIALRRGLIV